MKKIYLLCALAFAALPGCFEDTGNYDYRPAADVAPGEITGVESSYSVVMMENLRISPQIDGEKPGYEYLWYVQEIKSSYTSSDKAVVLAEQKELDIPITLSNGRYMLVLQVTDPEHDTRSFFKSTLNVTSEYTSGFFVLKDKDHRTDIDFIKPDGTVYPDILQTLHGDRLEGEAVGAGVLMNGYGYQVENPDGTVTRKTNASALFVLSSKDARVYDANSMSLIKTKEELFFEVPEVLRPQKIAVSWSGVYMVSDNKVHTIYSPAYGLGMFSYRYSGDDQVAPFVISGAYKNGLVFDQKSGSFKEVVPNQSTLIPFTGTSPVPSHDMNCEMVFMDEQEDGGGMWYYTALTLLRDKTTGDLYAVRHNDTYNYGDNPIKFYDKIPADRKIYDAKIYAANNRNNDIYFNCGDNKIYYYTFANQMETELDTDIPADETITYIRHIRYNYSPAFNALAVITSKDGGWKMYLYKFVESTSNVEGLHFDRPLSGDGTARYVMYRDVNTQYMN